MIGRPPPPARPSTARPAALGVNSRVARQLMPRKLFIQSFTSLKVKLHQPFGIQAGVIRLGIEIMRRRECQREGLLGYR